MISSYNIKKYLSYLYEKKIGSPIPAEILESWANLSDIEVKDHLNALYASWRMTEAESKAIEDDFYIKNARSKPIIPAIMEDEGNIPELESDVGYYEYPENPKRYKPLLLVVGICVLLIGVVYFVRSSTVNATIAEETKQELDEVKKEVEKVNNSVANERKQNEEYRQKQEAQRLQKIKDLEFRASQEKQAYIECEEKMIMNADQYENTKNKVTLRFRKQKDEAAYYYEQTLYWQSEGIKHKANYDNLQNEISRLKTNK